MAKLETRRRSSPVARGLVRRLQAEDLDLSPDLLREIVRDQMRRWARKGGRARAKALSPARRRELARHANAVRRARKETR